VTESPPAQPLFTVRRAVFGDEPSLRAVRLETIAEAPNAFCTTRERELARTAEDWRRWISPGFTLILEQSGVARGLVSGRIDAGDPTIAYLAAMWVHPDLRASGAADALVVEHLACARDNGANLVRLEVFATNERARRLYERHGFRATGHETAREGDGRPQIQMERTLGA
jgi:ribosomal protein S18 acetylase RimI-like enzyme